MGRLNLAPTQHAAYLSLEADDVTRLDAYSRLFASMDTHDQRAGTPTEVSHTRHGCVGCHPPPRPTPARLRLGTIPCSHRSPAWMTCRAAEDRETENVRGAQGKCTLISVFEAFTPTSRAMASLDGSATSSPNCEGYIIRRHVTLRLCILILMRQSPPYSFSSISDRMSIGTEICRVT